MNTYILWGVAISIAALIVLIWYLRRNDMKKELKIFRQISDFAAENQCRINTWDYWDRTIIAIDNEETDKLFFMRTMPGGTVRECISLSAYVDCRMQKASRIVKLDNANVSVTDKIELYLKTAEKSGRDICLEFYNSDYDHLTLTGELQLALKWCGIIRSVLFANQDKPQRVKSEPAMKTSGLQQKPTVSKKQVEPLLPV